MAQSSNVLRFILQHSLSAFSLLGLGAISACQCSPAFEDCQDQSDNDGDGFIDCNDTDCSKVSFCIAPFCGDGLLDAGEECDDGSQNSDTSPNACRVDCVLPDCGDSVIDSGEECDDGNNIQSDGCHLCTIITFKLCGNGALNPGEECDDGNLSSGDGCSNSCKIEVPPVCGDGQIKGQEACDDGNINAGDGCDNTCAIEAGFACFGAPSVCSACGDGVALPNETCMSLVSLPTDPDPFGVALFDADGDGDLDFAVSLNLGDQVWIYQNNAGQFINSQSIILEPDSLPGGLAAADLDGDGDQDLVVTESNRNRVRLIENQAGQLVAGEDFFVGVNPDFGVVILDLDGDGLLDLAAVNTDSQQSAPQDTVSVLLGLGGLEFAQGPVIEVGETPFALLAVDLFGDGLPELISGNLDGRSLSVIPNNGALGVSQLINAQSVIAGLASGDLDGDNDLDVVASQLETNRLLLLTNGSGVLNASQSLSVNSAGPVGVIVADLNGDTLLDLASANLFADDVSLFYQHQGAFLPASVVDTALGPEPLAAGDLNGDGRADLIVGNRFANSVSVLLSVPY
jgi:cysteine-rich repeat protein